MPWAPVAPVSDSVHEASVPLPPVAVTFTVNTPAEIPVMVPNMKFAGVPVW